MQRLVVMAAFVVVVLLSAGCEQLIGRGPDPTPSACEQVYSPRRCLAIMDAATAYSDATRDDIDTIEIVPSPPPSDDHILQTLGGAAPITVRVVMHDGTTFDTQMCGGIASGPACADEPPAWASGGDLIGSGYHDVPCAGEPPDGCATPVPSIDPAVAPDAIPISVPSRTIAIDHQGRYEISLGAGALPNGILSAATYRIADPWATDVTYGDEAAPRLEIRSLEPDGKPFQNIYEHGWRDGLERVEAVLVFDVKRFDPGATIEVQDVHVR